jgi:hypothetical protein
VARRRSARRPSLPTRTGEIGTSGANRWRDRLGRRRSEDDDPGNSCSAVVEDGDGGDEDGGGDRWRRQWGSDLVEDGVGGGEDRWRRQRGTVGEDGGTAGRNS